VDRARGQGFGRLVTANALVDALEAGSEWVHLGVFADNPGAIALYERLGFVAGMEPGPDMMLVG
jgi:ribosomal protein S18 acetylase RimI-like enzyme